MAKPLKKKILSFISIIVSGLIIGLIISFYLMLYFSVPVTDGELELDGIDAPVEITFDEMGIPQIWAQSEADAYFALGYQHAADRMFQMDLSRRIARGKLSEMLGSITESIDQLQKKIGHHRIAATYLDSLSEDTKANLQAYADGINSYRKTCRAIPFEYRFLPVDFVEWTISDCLALFSFQTWYSNSLMNRDSFYNKLVKKVGIEKAQTLLFAYPEWSHAVVDDNTNYSTNDIHQFNDMFQFKYQLDSEKASSGSPFQYAVAEKLFESSLPFLMTEASNCWVVAPTKSASGHAMLASDPHLEIARLPQFWYAVGIHIEETNLNTFGITTPGLPFVVMGHNSISAWAFTAGGNNVVDYTSLELHPENTNQYKTAVGWKDFKNISESIYTSTSDTGIMLDVKISDYGVVVEEDSTEHTVLAVNWIGYQQNLQTAVSHAFRMPAIESYDEFRAIVTNVGALDCNYMYADKSGNIGYQLATSLPKRDINIPNITNDYLTGVIEYEFYSKDSTANLYNPDKGWIATCNNIPEHTIMYDGFYFADRIISITELLESKDKLSVDDMYAFQFDRKNRYLKFINEVVIETLTLLDSTALAEKFNRYDYSFDTSSAEAALLVLYLDKFKEYTFYDNIGDLYTEVPPRWIENLSQVEASGWFDDRNTEKAEESMLDISIRAMRDALEITDNRTWGEFQTVSMEHPMAVIPILGTLLDLATDREPHGGSPGTLNASFYTKHADSSYSSIAGASMRFVIDFVDSDAATIVLPAGNSGNPMSDHFLDFYPMWKSNERWNVPLSKEKVYSKAASVLTLTPTE